MKTMKLNLKTKIDKSISSFLGYKSIKLSLNCFFKYYDKRVHGIKNTWMKIKNEFPDVLAPTWREVYHWIRQGYWSIRKSDRLRPYYIKGRKRKVGIFSKFKDKNMYSLYD